MMSIKAYTAELTRALDSISPEALSQATAILERAYDHEQAIYATGNGQSASTADAFALDLYKQTVGNTPIRRFHAVSLSSNVAALTAWGNDVGYDAIFVEQLRAYHRKGDVLVVFSASGNSPNVVKAAEWVHEHEGFVVALTGFTGGRLRQIADACVHVDVADYGHAETAHVCIMHYWVDYFKEKLGISA